MIDIENLLRTTIHVHQYDAEQNLTAEYDLVPTEIYGIDPETGEPDELAYVQFAYDLDQGHLEIRIPIASLKTE